MHTFFFENRKGRHHQEDLDGRNRKGFCGLYSNGSEQISVVRS
jgi:hypothetical protein